MKIIQNRTPKILISIYSLIFLASILYSIYLFLGPEKAGQFAFIPMIIITSPFSAFLIPIFDSIGFIDWYSKYAEVNNFVFLASVILMFSISFLINSWIIYKVSSFIVNKFKK